MLRRPVAVQASADHIGRFEDDNVLLGYAAVSYQIGSTGKRRDAATDQIRLRVVPTEVFATPCHRMNRCQLP